MLSIYLSTLTVYLLVKNTFWIFDFSLSPTFSCKRCNKICKVLKSYSFTSWWWHFYFRRIVFHTPVCLSSCNSNAQNIIMFWNSSKFFEIRRKNIINFNRCLIHHLVISWTVYEMLKSIFIYWILFSWAGILLSRHWFNHKVYIQFN